MSQKRTILLYTLSTMSRLWNPDCVPVLPEYGSLLACYTLILDDPDGDQLIRSVAGNIPERMVQIGLTTSNLSRERIRDLLALNLLVNRVCANCAYDANPRSLSLCARCLSVWYCDEKCRAEHEGKHEAACRSYSKTVWLG